MSFKFLNWRVSIGVSVFSLLFNFAYFYIVRHNWHEALVLSGSSIFTIGTMHLAHSIKSSNETKG